MRNRAVCFDGGPDVTIGEDARGAPACLPAEDERVFALIAAGQPLPQGCAESVARLANWGFVALDEGRGNRPIALDPGTVARRRVQEMLQENAANLAAMAELPSVTDRLAQAYERSQWRAGHGSEYIDDPAVVNARLKDAVGCAEREILAAQPGGPRTRALLDLALERDAAALDRGVALRTLYRATVRDNTLTAEYARMMSTRTAGRRAEYRTLVEPFERAIIIDRHFAVISNHLVEDAPEHAAWIITDRAMVAYIVAEWEGKWRRADRWHGELRAPGQPPVDTVSAATPGGVRTTRRQREILRDQCEAITQEVTARRLGISRRTVTKEIDELKARFGAGSLMQLAIRWSQSPDRLVDDTDTTAGCPSAPQPGDGGGRAVA